MGEGDGWPYTCLVDAYSVSETLSLLDYGTNYCNLFNLMDPAWSTTPTSPRTPTTSSALSAQLRTATSIEHQRQLKKIMKTNTILFAIALSLNKKNTNEI